MDVVYSKATVKSAQDQVFKQRLKWKDLSVEKGIKNIINLVVKRIKSVQGYVSKLILHKTIWAGSSIILFKKRDRLVLWKYAYVDDME